jgi:hypothetical protein
VCGALGHRYVCCEPEVWQEGWVQGRVSLEVDCVGGGLWLGLLDAGGWADCTDGGL